MVERTTRKLGLLLILLGIFGCSDGSDFPPSQEEESRVGFEILEIQSPTSIRAWISPEITFEEFEALEVDPLGDLHGGDRDLHGGRLALLQVLIVILDDVLGLDLLAGHQVVVLELQVRVLTHQGWMSSRSTVSVSLC